jgi:hypothetical protein
MPHRWYSKYTTKLSDFAEKYSEGHKWGNDVVDRKTGEKVWEPMPLVRLPSPCADNPGSRFMREVEGVRSRC